MADILTQSHQVDDSSLSMNSLENEEFLDAENPSSQNHNFARNGMNQQACFNDNYLVFSIKGIKMPQITDIFLD